jgi:hypothetical protein
MLLFAVPSPQRITTFRRCLCFPANECHPILIKVDLQVQFTIGDQTVGWPGWTELSTERLKHFAAHTNASIQNHFLFMMDNNASHTSLQFYLFCKENGICIVSIPPHTSPLDVTSAHSKLLCTRDVIFSWNAMPRKKSRPMTLFPCLIRRIAGCQA